MAADSVMGTCPSPEIADSRKRPLDGDTENGDIKRSHFSPECPQGKYDFILSSTNHSEPCSCEDSWIPREIICTSEVYPISSQPGGEATYHFKTLVPSVAVGAIIGKSGETILQLQNETGAKVKMSKSHDFYPGTTERVCLISGSVEAILRVMDFIMDKIREKPDLSKTFAGDTDCKLLQERDKQVKILVPNSTAGMIIGKAGNYIKQIKEQSGSYVQISQKAKDISLQERCITVVGDKECNKRACMMILSKVQDDPSSGSCTNVSYADVMGPVANYNPTGSPYAQSQQAHAFSSSTASLNNSGLTGVGTAAGVLMNGTGLSSLNFTINLTSPHTAATTITPPILDHIKSQLRVSGHPEAGITEICAALNLLSKHGLLGLALPPLASLPTVPTLPTATLPYFSSLPDPATTTSVYGAIGQVNLAQDGAWPPAAYYDTVLGNTSPTTRNSLDRFTASASDLVFETFRQPVVAPVTLNNNSFGLATGGAGGPNVAGGLLPISKSPTPGDLGAMESLNEKIPEVIVGAILGPGGRNLVEIQKASGAVIQISKKGNFAPGTRDRIVTISGSPNAIQTALYYIKQRISEEEMKRARQNTLPGIIQ